MRSTTFGTLCLSLVLCGLSSLSAKAQPTVLSADPRGNPTGVTVVYSEPMDATSAQATGNYVLTNAVGTPVPISSATLAPDQTNLFLQLGGSLQLTTNYTLKISDVKNLSQTPISPNPTLVGFWYGGNPNDFTYSFNDGRVPGGTRLAVGPDTAGRQVNPYQCVTNVGGYTNSGCLILANPASGETFAQWRIMDDLSLGTPATNLYMTFKLFVGSGSGGNAGVPNSGGNGVLWHWGPGLLEQYSGGASSFGSGLDVTFRTYNSAPNTVGANVYYGGTAGAGNNAPIATSTNISYFDTNGPSVAVDFARAVDVTLSISNKILNLSYSNAVLGNVVCFNNYSLPASFSPPAMGGDNLAFTTTDGAGAHESAWMDNVDFYINGRHVMGSSQVGPVGIVLQPANLTTNENVQVTFNVGVTGAPPITYQWYSNDVAIAGATAPTYTTPLTLYSTMNGTHYKVAVSNDFSGVISDDAILTLIPDTNGVQVVSVGSINGSSVGVLFTGYVDPVSGGNPANYRVNGIQPMAATVRTAFANYGNAVVNYAPSYLKTVKLTLASPVSSGYTVTVKSNVLSRTGLARSYDTNLVGQVEGLSDADLVTLGPPQDPVATGEAFSAGANQVEVIGGGSDAVAIGAGGIADHGHFAYVQRTGNFDLKAKLTWETLTANGAKAGMMIRSPAMSLPTDASSATIAQTVFPAAPGRNTYETGMRAAYGSGGSSWAAPGVAGNGNVAAYWSAGGNWIRIRRTADTFAGFASADGVNWQQIGLAVPNTNDFPAIESVGLMTTAANNDGRLCEANFQSFGMTVFSNANVAITTDLPASVTAEEWHSVTLSVVATVSGSGVAASDLTYQWQRAEASSPAVFNDIIERGSVRTYATPLLHVTTPTVDNGARYRVIAYVGDISSGHSRTSAVTTLIVGPDVTPPFMVGAAADSTFVQVSIDFDGPMDYGSLGTPGNYTLVPVQGGAARTISSAAPTLSADGVTYTNVLLTLDSGTPMAPGVKYLLTAANVLDAGGNNISGTTVPGGKSRVVSGWVLAYGYLKYERWLGASYPSGAGPYFSTVDTLLYNPKFQFPADVIQLITYSGYPNGDIGNPSANAFDFGARISGYFIPSTTASYNWYVRGNDGTALWVSPTSTMPNPLVDLHKAAANTSFAAPGPSWIASQTNLGIIFVNAYPPDTTPIAMTAGQPYAITALEQQGNGTSFIEFTCGTDGSTVQGGISITNTAGGAYPGAGRGGAPTNTYNLKGTNIATYVNPDVSLITATGLSNLVVEAYHVGTFSVSATSQVSAGGTPTSGGPVLYQWYLNGSLIAGATSASYSPPPATYPAPTDTYSVVMSVAGLSFMTITNSATLTVIQDVTRPVVVASSSFAGNTLCLRFDGLLNGASVTNGTYAVAGANVTSARLLSDGVTVVLTLDQKLTGGTFTVTVSGVQDLAGNLILPGTIVNGSLLATQLAGAVDIGVGTNSLGLYVVQTNSQPALTNVTFDVNYPGTTVMVTNGVFEIQAGGLDIANRQDGQHFVYEQRTGDFDIKVRVDGLIVANNASKAGLMLRESLAPGSRRYNIVADPPNTAAADGSGLGLNKVEVTMRTAADGTSATWGNNPAPANLGTGASSAQVPGLWLRLKLVGRTVYAYTGADGVNWALAGRENLAANWPLSGFYVGMCVSARNTNPLAGAYTAARLSNYGDYTAPATKRALFLIGDEMNVPAGAPNATPTGGGAAIPQQASDTRVWNTLIAMGYNVTATRNETFRQEDAEGVSVVLWSSTGNSGGTGNPSLLTTMPVPMLIWEASSWGKLKMASADGDTVGSKTTINITNVAAPTASVLSAGFGVGSRTVTTSETYSRALKSTLGAGVVIVASQDTDATRTVFWAYEQGAAMSGINAPHRRVGFFLNDNGAAVLNADGFKVFTNAIDWASIKNDEAPTIWSQPASQTVLPGSPVTFMVTAVGGSGPYTYQWAKVVGVTPVDITGATNRDYTILAATLADAGNYLVRVTALGSGLSVTSSVATLQVVNTAPAPVAWGLSGGNLNLSWPSDHIGWRLVVQTNSLGVGIVPSGTWYTWPNSTTVNSVAIPIDANAPTVFFRLVYP